MKKYVAFFRLRLSMGLQYRTAAIAGMITQFFWGAMEILALHAFYRADPASFPMTFEAAASYVWLQQAFLALFAPWMLDNDIFDTITDGNVSYELCRPYSIYQMWFSKSLATRVSRAALRCMPVLLVAFCLPNPYRMTLPPDLFTFVYFLLTLILSLLTTVSFCMLLYMISFFTISSAGVRIVATAAAEFLAGGIIPLPFFPDPIRGVLEYLPFAAMQNVPLRVYSGDIGAGALHRTVMLQISWLITMVLIGKYMERLATKRVIIQGG